MASRILLLLLLALPARAQVIGPLLQTEWHQYEPFNNWCPTIDGKSTLVGCVATALTEIMYIYKYPEATLDTLHGWKTEKYNLADVMPGATLKWDLIMDDYDHHYRTHRQKEAVAELSYYAGLACRMKYGVDASGADTERYTESLPRVFGYQYVNMYDRSYYSPGTWRSILIYELSQGHPLLYTGYNQELGGHAFVIDGYDGDTGFFHTGWGYGGAYNGWFDLDVLNPFEDAGDPTEWGRREGFFCNQAALAFSPRPCRPFAADSLRWDVQLDSVSAEALHVGNTCEAVFHFTNNTPDTLTYTYEVLSNSPSDTAFFAQADYVGLSAVTLLPYASASDRVLLRLKEYGTRLLRISPDDEWLSQAVEVEIGATGTTFQPGELEVVEMGEDFASFKLHADGRGMVTWCLFPDEGMQADTDVRHWSLGEDTVTFRRLIPGHTYTLAVRYPWQVIHKYSFTAGATPVESMASVAGSDACFDLQGRRHTGRPDTKVYIRNGRKFAQ